MLGKGREGGEGKGKEAEGKGQSTVGNGCRIKLGWKLWYQTDKVQFNSKALNMTKGYF